MAKITSEVLKATAPKTPAAKRDRFLPYLNLILPHYEIDTELRISAFLATCCIESDYWKALAEYGKGKGRKYAKVYADTGKAYYGRGIIQNTWLDAYKDFTAYVARNWSWLKNLAGSSAPESAPDFVKYPDLLTEPFWAVVAACWYWHKNKLNKLADGGTKQFFAIQGIVNRGDATKQALHFIDRLAVYEILRRVLPDNFKLASTVSAAVSQESAQTSNETTNQPQIPLNQPPPIENQAEEKPLENQPQIAENIINNGDAPTLPPDFKPADKTAVAPAPSGMLRRAWFWVAGLGILPTTGTGVIEAFRSLSSDGGLNFGNVFGAMKEVLIFLMPYLFYVALAFIVFWGIKEALKQVSFMLNQYTLARGDMNNVRVVPSETTTPSLMRALFTREGMIRAITEATERIFIQGRKTK